MFTRDISGFEVGGRRPVGLAGTEAEAKRLAAWTAAWETRIRCCGVTRAGVQCKNLPMRGRLTCRRHGPAGSARHPLKKPPTALAEHAREMRRLWRADPWVAGYTVELNPEGQERLEVWTAGVGVTWAWLSPRVQDFARWAYVNSCRSGRHPDVDARASDSLAERIRRHDRKDSTESAGGHVDRMAASGRLARYREVPPLGQRASGWSPSRNGKPRRVIQAAAIELARDRALAASEPQNRKEAVARLLALERVAAREAQQRRDQQVVLGRMPSVDRNGW